MKKNMSNEEIVKQFWQLFDTGQIDEAGELLHDDFICEWITTGEKFNKEQFIKVNKDYPLSWYTKLQQYYDVKNKGISIVHVYSDEAEARFYVTSIYEFKENSILRVEEYWATCEEVPKWRKSYSI